MGTPIHSQDICFLREAVFSSLKGCAMRKSIRTSVALLVVALAAASFMLLLPGCAGGTNDSPGKPDAVGNRAADNTDATVQGDVVSTAMVAYANGDQLLFVDQETQTPYIPTELDDATIIVNGQQADEDALVAGNIVQVTGNGIMLESYPGQYPGITKVEVIEQGNPADAEQYAEIVDTVFAAPDQSQVPAGNLNYKTDLADTSVILNPYEFDWQWVTDDGQTSTSQVDGSVADGNGYLIETIADARISAATDAFIAFSVNPTALEIERQPLVKDAAPRIDPQMDSEDVSYTLGDDGTAALRIEPNFLYEVKVTFPQGEAEYAFYTMN